MHPFRQQLSQHLGRPGRHKDQENTTQVHSPGKDTQTGRGRPHLVWDVLHARGKLTFLLPGKENLICCQSPATGLGDKISDKDLGGWRRYGHIPPGTPARTLFQCHGSDRLTGHSVPGTHRAGQGLAFPLGGHGPRRGCHTPGAKEQREGHPSGWWTSFPVGSASVTEPQPGASEGGLGAQELTFHPTPSFRRATRNLVLLL